MKLFVLSLLTLAAISSAHATVGIGNNNTAVGGGNAPEPASTALLLMGASAVGGKIVKNYKNKKKKDADQA